MNARRLLTLFGLCLLVATFSACTYYFPHSLVASNIRTTADPLTAGGKRLEAEVCGNRLIGIPFGPDPKMAAVMDALQVQATNAIGFEDIRIDVSFVNYLFPIFFQNCVYASAYPLFAVKAHPPKAAARRSAAPAEPPPAPASEEPSDAAPAPPAPAPDPFVK
jgi:hypothetical protein